MLTIKTVVGITTIIVGVILMIFAKIIGWIYGPILVIIGVMFIIYQKDEGTIEKRKDIKTRRASK